MKSFLSTIIFCQKDLWRTNKITFIYFYLLSIPRAFNPFLWSIGIKTLVDIASLHIITKQNITISHLVPFIVTTSIYLVITFLNGCFNRYLDNKMSLEYTAYYKLKLSKKLETLDLQRFEDSKFLDNLSKAESNQVQILNVFKESSNLLRYFLQAIIATASLVTLNFLIPIIIILIEGGIIFYRNRFNAIYREVDKELLPVKRREGNYLSLFFRKTSIEEMRIYGLNDYIRSRVQELDDIIFSRLLGLVKSKILTFGLINFVENFVIEIGSRLYAFWAIINDKISIGDFFFYNNQIGTLSNALGSFGQSVNVIFRDSLEINYTEQIYELQPILDYSLSKKTFNTPNIEIKFQNVSFAYPGVENRLILKDFNLTINDGEKIALIGVNGAGKTTIIKLLLRYYDPTDGQILINGVDLKKIDINWWYKQIGVLFQDFMRYETTVAENVGYGNISQIENENKMTDAIRQSSSEDFIMDYPDKLNQTLGRQFNNSIQPSGGQWQKIALARTFFRNSQILILDEPTSSIDAKAESEIFEKVENLSKNKTVIIISHRFSTVRNAERIIVIKDGRIHEQGSHQELIDLNGKYAELFELQAKGYK